MISAHEVKLYEFWAKEKKKFLSLYEPCTCIGRQEVSGALVAGVNGSQRPSWFWGVTSLVVSEPIELHMVVSKEVNVACKGYYYKHQT